jgi:hypothetical protein
MVCWTPDRFRAPHPCRGFTFAPLQDTAGTHFGVFSVPAT